MISVNFVCLGNICRSPAGAQILLNMAKKEGIEEFHVESSGLGGWHVGQLPDRRMREASARRGVTLISRAQQFTEDMFERFDFILGVSHEIVRDLRSQAPTSEKMAKVHLLTTFSETYFEEDIPDPYYSGDEGFERVLTMLEDSSAGFIAHLRKSGRL